MTISKKHVAVYKISHLHNRQMEKVGHWQEHATFNSKKKDNGKNIAIQFPVELVCITILITLVCVPLRD